MDWFLAGLWLEEEKLRDHQRRYVVVHGTHEADDAVFEQPRVDVIAALPSASLFNDDGHKRLWWWSPGRAIPEHGKCGQRFLFRYELKLKDEMYHAHRTVALNVIWRHPPTLARMGLRIRLISCWPSIQIHTNKCLYAAPKLRLLFYNYDENQDPIVLVLLFADAAFTQINFKLLGTFLGKWHDYSLIKKYRDVHIRCSCLVGCCLSGRCGGTRQIWRSLEFIRQSSGEFWYFQSTEPLWLTVCLFFCCHFFLPGNHRRQNVISSLVSWFTGVKKWPSVSLFSSLQGNLFCGESRLLHAPAALSAVFEHLGRKVTRGRRGKE